MKEIAKRGGVILDSAPLDGNENMYDRVTEEKTGLAHIRGPVHVVSHPREFRKPNYLMALATGEFNVLIYQSVFIYWMVFVLLGCGGLVSLSAWLLMCAVVLSLSE